MGHRDYQLAAINSFYKHYEKGYRGHPVIVMPTGTGKSHVIAGIAEQSLKNWPNLKILIVTHVKELIEQNYNKIKAAWPDSPVGLYSAGLKKKQTQYPITYCGIQSIQRNPHVFGKVDLVIVDECHMISTDEKTAYRKFFAALTDVNPQLAVVGLTATPWRMGYGAIYDQPDSFFERVCIDLSTYECFNWFIDQGYLVPVIPRPTKMTLDTSGVGTTAGEFNLQQLQEAVNVDSKTMAALTQCVEECSGLDSWLIFCSGIEHSLRVAELLTEMGIECRAVHSNLTDVERDEILEDFKAGRLQAVANNGILTTGFDHPGLKLIVGLRPSKSSALWTQMLGRGTRPAYEEGFDLSTLEGRLEAIRQSDKRHCMVYDFSDNVRRLGPINDPVYPRRKGDKAGKAPVRECEACHTINHARAVQCIYCGEVFPQERKLQLTASNADIIKKKTSEMPVIEEYEVERINVLKHEGRNGKPDMLRVVYYCGYRVFNEYICLEHPVGTFPRNKAGRWWRERAPSTPIPDKVDIALVQINMGIVAIPTHIRVHTNLKYPEIKAYDFKGTFFGREAEKSVNIETQVNLPDSPEAYAEAGDDDVPF